MYPSETTEYKDKVLKKQPEKIDTCKELIDFSTPTIQQFFINKKNPLSLKITLPIISTAADVYVETFKNFLCEKRQLNIINVLKVTKPVKGKGERLSGKH